MKMFIKGLLKTAVMYAVCHGWISEETTFNLFSFFELKNV